MERVTKKVSTNLDVSKVEDDRFRYTGIYVEALEDGIQIKMEDFVKSLEEVKEIRRADRNEELSNLEMKV